MHLTNYAINKKNKNFVENQEDESEGKSHKWSLAQLWKYFDE